MKTKTKIKTETKTKIDAPSNAITTGPASKTAPGNTIATGPASAKSTTYQAFRRTFVQLGCLSNS